MKCSNLDVWKRSVQLSIEVYKYFKSSKDFGFKDQITRSCSSISSNLAVSIEKINAKATLYIFKIHPRKNYLKRYLLILKP